MVFNFPDQPLNIPMSDVKWKFLDHNLNDIKNNMDEIDIEYSKKVKESFKYYGIDNSNLLQAISSKEESIKFKKENPTFAFGSLKYPKE